MNILIAFMIGVDIGLIICDIGLVVLLIWDKLANGIGERMRELEFREIKFRAFDTKNKTWTYVTLGDLVCGACTNHGDKPLSGAIQIWCEYTGLKDKNGKEIYEGDIVEALIDGAWATGKNSVSFGKAKWKLEVIYNDIRFMDVFRVIGSKNTPDRIYYLFDNELSELEVIGNIYDNPELLEREDARN